MTEFRTKNLGRPDEVVEMPGVKLDIVELGDLTIARAVHDPGWRWSTHVRPRVGGEWCQVRHVITILSGRFGVLLDDGTSYELGPDDVAEIRPGHDGYVIGHEPCVILEWVGVRAFTGFTGMAPAGVLATLLVTGIVGADARAAELGEERWRTLLSNHIESIEGKLERLRAREVRSNTDGVLATFDGPAQALLCAEEIRRTGRAAGLATRAAVHVGEVELAGNDVRGAAVKEVEAMARVAGPDEILASETTRALAAASGLTFEERGVFALDGVPEERRLYAFTGS